MSKFFNPPFIGRRTETIIPIYDYHVSRLNNELDKIKTFYRTNLQAVTNSHLLVKILTDYLSFMHYTPETLYRYIRQDIIRLESAYGLTSPYVNSGISREGMFYNKHNLEVLLSVSYNVDVEKCYQNYKDLKPLRVVQHDFTDLTMPIPNGKNPVNTPGLVVIAIDLALLALQFKAWYDKEKFVKETNTHTPLHNFIYRYPLTNMVSTHTDVAIFNRFYNILTGIENPQANNYHSFLVYNHGTNIDQTHKQLIETIKKRPSNYSSYLQSMPSLEYGTYYRSVLYPDMAPTRQVKWALVLSKLKQIEVCLALDDLNNGAAINLLTRQDILRELRILVNDKSLIQNLPSNYYSRIEAIIAKLSKLA